MYPLSFWADGGKLLDETPADSQQHKYNCWGWPQADCMFAKDNVDDLDYGLTSTTPNAAIHISFCPSDGPVPASVGLDPTGTDFPTQATVIVISTTTEIPVLTTWISADASTTKYPGINSATTSALLPTPTSVDDAAHALFCRTATQTNCFQLNTQVVEDETMTVPVGAPLYATLLPTTTTSILPTPTADRPSYLPTGGSFSTTATFSVPVRTSTRTITSTPMVPPATVSTGMTSYNSTATALAFSPTSPPKVYYTLTSWTTYSVLNGSTVSLVGAQMGEPTTIGVTYGLAPGTMVPISILSSISVRSTQSLSASAAYGAANTGPSKDRKSVGTVAGLVIMILALIGLGLWLICVRTKRRRYTPDYVARRSPVRSSARIGGTRVGPGSCGGPALDLNSDPQPRASFVEPWIGGQPFQRHDQKIQREMGESGRSRIMTAPGQMLRGSMTDGTHSASRRLKSIIRAPPERTSRVSSEQPMHNSVLSSEHDSPEPVQNLVPHPVSSGFSDYHSSPLL
ncbi:hypothetical protein RhiJN_04932 [Ceratobasidium sp. AG-Ba]|nr:hypothetical protein RhiJN_04932 [Ceratobasidium sp. AG-Ba]